MHILRYLVLFTIVFWLIACVEPGSVKQTEPNEQNMTVGQTVQHSRLSSTPSALKPEVFVQTGHSMSVLSTDFSPDGRYILSGGADNILKLW